MKTYEDHWSDMSHIKSDDLLDTMLTCHLDFCEDDVKLAAMLDIITDKPTAHEMLVEEREPSIDEEDMADYDSDDE